MDKYSKGGERGFMAPKKGYKSAFKDIASERGQDGQFCNRVGCSGRIKYGQNIKSGSSDKGEQSQPVFPSSNGNGSRGSPTMARAKKSSLDSKSNLSSQSRCHTSESSMSSDSGGAVSPPSRSPTSYQSESMKNSGKFTLTEGSSSNSSVNVRVNKVSHNKSVSHNQNTQNVKPVRKSSDPGPLNNNGSRYALRNLKCNSTSDVVPPNSSSSHSKSIRKNVMEKTESSLSGKRRKTPLPLDRHVSPSTSGVSISDSRRNSSTRGEGSSDAAPVRNRRSTVGNSRMRLSCLPNGRNHSGGSSQVSDNEIPINIGGRGSLRQFSANLSSSSSSSYSLSSSNNGDYSFGSLPFTPAELSFTNLVNRMDGIAEVLLALERMEQNEELTHEQLQALETSLFLSGLNIYDQHRDMRLDIDNMSYEELLALEERMGTVSTALPEEALSSCLKRDKYQVTPSELRLTGSAEEGDDIKCSICQEEYVSGDEMGRLVECRHGFHEMCINQWLRLKKWCPICKTEAAPTQ